MYFQEHDHEHCDDQQWVKPLRLSLRLGPSHQLRHQKWRIEWRSRLKDDTDLDAIFIECGHTVRVGLVLAAMPDVLLAVAQQHLVQLLEVILGKRDVLPGPKD